MMIPLIILSCLLWVTAFLALPKRIIIAPALSYCALLVVSFARLNGYTIVPLGTPMTISWLCITLVMTLILIVQNPALRQQSRGVGYMTLGSLAGMAVGLMAFTFSASLNALYAIMLGATVVGTFLGLFLFSNTPDGSEIRLPSHRFFRYLLAKGFPVVITTAQLGIAAVIIIALLNSF